MSDLVMRAAELVGVIIKQRVDEDTSGLRAQLMEARSELADTRLYADKVADERDAARAELAGVAAQRDAYLSRSVELVTRVTESEAALKRTSCTLTATAAVEVDGFRVGDLVRWVRLASTPLGMVHWRPLTRVERGRGWYNGSAPGGYVLEDIVRKPVEVGDTVRFAGIGIAETCVVRSIQSNEVGVKWCYFDDDACARLADCIAVAP